MSTPNVAIMRATSGEPLLAIGRSMPRYIKTDANPATRNANRLAAYGLIRFILKSANAV